MKRAVSFILTVIIAVACQAQTEAKKEAPTDKAAKQVEAAKEKAPQSATEALSQRIESVDFEETPLCQVIDHLATTTNTNIVVFWNRLREAGIDRKTPVTLKVRGLPFDRVLKLALDQIISEEDLVFSADEDLIMISTANDFKGKMAVRVYDVKWIIQTMPYFRNKASDGAEDDMTKPPALVNEIGGGLPPQLNYDREATLKRPILNGFMLENEESRQQIYDKLQRDPERLMLDLVDVITACVEPDSWAEYGGRGTIVPYRGKLIINNSLLVHSKLSAQLSPPEPIE